MARRIVRQGGNEVEIMGFYDTGGQWNFRNPRTGHWQQGNEYSRARGQRHQGQEGGPTAADLAGSPMFNMRYVVNGREFYRKERIPGGFDADFTGLDLLGGVEPPDIGDPEAS